MAQEPSREVLELLLEAKADGSRGSDKILEGLITGVLTGVLVRCDEAGQGYVSFDKVSVDSPVAARTLVSMTKVDVGRQVCLLFEQGQATKPIIIGFVQIRAIQDLPDPATVAAKGQSQVEVSIDGERIVFEGEKELVLKCGKASITLKQDGKVLIRGTYLSSQSSGPNLVKGGSVQLN